MPNDSLRAHLPQLASAYAAGRLVPFIGSGMSVPACTGWHAFVVSLCTQLGIAAPEPGAGEPERIRAADAATILLRAMSGTARQRFIRQALTPETVNAQLPPQSRALAILPWPLVISTNYDDVMWHALQSSRTPSRSLLLGRSVSDCQTVLRSLDWLTPPVLWAIQGFTGGPFLPTRGVIPDPERQDQLIDQVVIGHKQYQEAVNLAAHFRRAFGEVFRRRALFFVGSGITEDYLVNLFSEVLTMNGQRPGVHFALIRRDDLSPAKEGFLRDRLGISPIVYETHDDVPAFLEELAALAAGKSIFERLPLLHLRHKAFSSSPCAGAIVTPTKLQYCARFIGAGKQHDILIEFDNRSMDREPCNDSRVWVLSVGRGPPGKLFHGSMSRSVHEAAGLTIDDYEPAGDFVYRRRDGSPIIAVSARELAAKSEHKAQDWPDLRVVPLAIQEALLLVEKRKATVARIGLLAAGPYSPWHPIFSLVQMLVGIRQYGAPTEDERTRLRSIELAIVDPRVWSAITSECINISEVLSACDGPVLVAIMRGTVTTDLFVYLARQGATVADVMAHYGLLQSLWLFSIQPQYDLRPDERGPADVEVIALSTIQFSLRHDRFEGS